jgi:hypothetical protein
MIDALIWVYAPSLLIVVGGAVVVISRLLRRIRELEDQLSFSRACLVLLDREWQS